MFWVLRIHTNNKEKEAMHLKDNKGDYMEETGGKKREEMQQLYCNLKNKNSYKNSSYILKLFIISIKLRF